MPNHTLKGTYLLVDAAGQLVQTALWCDGAWLSWHGSRDEAGRSLFAGVADLFRKESRSIDDISGFFFCEGPGSILGIRMAAMAIRGWQSLLQKPLPVYAYNSHDLLARSLIARKTPPPFHVISDARRKRWNVTSVLPAETIEPLRRLPAEDMAGLDGSLFRMEEVIRGEIPGASAELLPYNLEGKAQHFLEAGLLHQVSAPDSLSPEGPDYKKWSPDRHR